MSPEESVRLRLLVELIRGNATTEALRNPQHLTDLVAHFAQFVLQSPSTPNPDTAVNPAARRGRQARDVDKLLA